MHDQLECRVHPGVARGGIADDLLQLGDVLFGLVPKQVKFKLLGLCGLFKLLEVDLAQAQDKAQVVAVFESKLS